MKIKHRALSLLLTLTLLLTFMPALAFAESDPVTKEEAKKAIAAQAAENRSSQKDLSKVAPSPKDAKSVKAYDDDDDDAYYDGSYSGKPVLATTDYTDTDGELDYFYEIEPKTGDSIVIDADDGTYTFVWSRDPDGSYYFEVPDNPDDYLEIGGIEVYDSPHPEAYMSVTRYVWDDDAEEYIDYWSATIYIDKFTIRNTVSRLVFEPGTIYLVAENIINYDEGMPYYSFLERSRHTTGGYPWTSPYAVGDKLTVYYVNGISQTFVDTDLYFEGYDEDYDYYYNYYNDWFAKGDNYIKALVDNDELTLGTNTVGISWHGVTANITVVVETAAQKAAREAAAARQAALARMMSVKTVTINSSTVNAATLNSAIAAAGGSKSYVTTVVLGSKVKKIAKNTFKGSAVTTVQVKSKKLKANTVKGSLKGSLVSTVKVTAGSKYKKAYKKIFTKKIAGKKVKVK